MGGVFAAPARGLEGAGSEHDSAWAAAVVMDGVRVLDAATVVGEFTAPYQPGYLALRQLGLLAAAVRTLTHPVDVLLVNATGRDHPRGAGLALHLGHELDLPTIGVTDRPLVATGKDAGVAAGSTTELRIDGEVVGYRLRPLAGARAICVSAGWRTDAVMAVRVVLDACAGQRTPAPLREARRLARVARSREDPGRGR